MASFGAPIMTPQLWWQQGVSAASPGRPSLKRGLPQADTTYIFTSASPRSVMHLNMPETACAVVPSGSNCTLHHLAVLSRTRRMPGTLPARRAWGEQSKAGGVSLAHRLKGGRGLRRVEMGCDIPACTIRR